MKVNWWLIAALELVLLLLIFTGFGLAYLSSSNKLLIDNNMQNIIHETKKEDEYSLVKRNMSDKFTLEGVKVEISRIGYDRFLSTIIGSLGDIEEINVSFRDLSLLSNHKVSDLLVRGLCGSCNQKV